MTQPDAVMKDAQLLWDYQLMSHSPGRVPSPSAWAVTTWAWPT